MRGLWEGGKDIGDRSNHRRGRRVDLWSVSRTQKYKGTRSVGQTVVQDKEDSDFNEKLKQT